MIQGEGTRNDQYFDLSNIWLVSRISQISHFNHPIFGKIQVNDYNRFVNPYTNKEEKLVLTNNKVVLPKVKVSLEDFRIDIENSDSYGANHLIRLYNKFYNLTKKEQLLAKGVSLKNYISTTEQIHKTMCFPENATQREIATRYYEEYFSSELTDFYSPSRILTSLQKLNSTFTLNGKLRSNNDEDFNMNCWRFPTQGDGSHKYLTYVLQNRVNKSNKLLSFPDEMDKEFQNLQKQYNLLCTLESRKVRDGNLNTTVEFTATDATRLETIKKLYPTRALSTWAETIATLKLIPWNLNDVNYFLPEKEGEITRAKYSEKYACYYDII